MPKPGSHGYSVKELSNLSFGQMGFTSITDTNAHAGTFVAIKAVHGDAVISTATSSIGDNLPTSMTVLEGDVIYGAFSSITLTSGKVLAYNG